MQSEPALNSMINLSGKRAVVTGGAKGIGLAISERLAEAGAAVLIADIDGEAAVASSAKLSGEGTRAVSYCADVSREDSVQDLINTAVKVIGGIDILANVAGIYPYIPLADNTQKDFSRVLDVNLTGTFTCCRQAAARMIEQGKGGSIINIASIEAIYPCHTGMFGYEASKAGVVMLTKSLAKELGRHDIRVNVIAPGGIKTAGMQSQLGNIPSQKNQKAWLKDFMGRMVLGRMGHPDEIARVAIFLASELSSYVTGSMIVADGGYLVG